MGLQARTHYTGLIVLLLSSASNAAGQKHDLLLRGGHVIDPRNQIDGRMDVAVRNGRIAAVQASIDPATANQVIDVNGLYVTPGLVDLHVHVFYTSNAPGAWAGDASVAPDSFSFRSGVTTMVDAGSSGYRNFDFFRTTVIDRAKTRILAMINVAGYGMLSNSVEQTVADMLPERIVETAKKHKDVVVGVKAAHFEGPSWASVEKAVEAGKLANVPVMVDFGYFLRERPYWQLVTEKLRPGDISTHFFRSGVPITGSDGKLLSYLQAARKRGVKFDVGHGGGSFVFRNAVPAIAQGFYPDSISTDLHTGSMNAGMTDMQTTMSKMLILGMPLKEAILRSTWNPARMISRDDLGHLSVGAVADLAVFQLDKGEFGFRDSSDGKASGNQRLICEMTLKDGKIEWDWNSRSAIDWRKLPPDYGLRKDMDFIVLPPGSK